MRDNKNCILDECAGLQPFTGLKEGIDYIDVNVGHQVTTDDKQWSKLGHFLAPDNSTPFDTPFGRMISMMSYMQYLSTPGFPIKFLNRIPKSRSDFKSIPKKTVSVPNFYALVALGLCCKVKSNKEIQELIINNKLPYTAIMKSTKESEFFGYKTMVNNINPKLGRYVAIIRYIEAMLRDGTFQDDEKVKEFIGFCKDYPDKDIMDGVAFNIKK